MEMVYVTSP